MEELQLTLTPSRVDQRNQGVMLANWRVGQTISALVSDRMPSGEILLKVGSQSFITSRDIPVQPGTRIQLEVHQIDPRLILKVVNQINVGPALQTPDRLLNSTPLNQHTPGVSGLVDLLKNLANSSRRASPGQASTASELQALLTSNFLKLGALNARSIQTALVLSGIFTEALWLSNRPLLGARSTKTILMLLKQRVVKELSLSNLPSDKRTALTQIGSAIDSSITSITHQQILSIPQDPEKPKWLATLPLEFGEEIIEIEVEIEGSPRRPDDESSGWKLEFLLELKSLGPVRVSLEMRNGRLGIDFSVTASINERLDGALPILRDRLLASGLQLDHVSTSVFKAESEGEIRASQVRLDISV